MSTMSTTQKKRDWAPVIRMSMAIVVTAAIYFPLFLVQTVETPLPAATEWNDEIKVVALPPYAELQRWDRLGKSLYRWTDIGNPTLLILPNNELGFSRFRPGSPPRDTLPPPPVSWQPTQQPPPPWPPITLTITPQPVAQTMAEEWPQDTALNLPAVPPRQPVVGVFWRDIRGRAITDPPTLSDSDLQSALADGLPKQMTRIEIQHHDLLPIPRLIIRQSCGNPRLDTAIVLALRERLEKQRTAAKLVALGNPSEQPTAYSNCVLEVDWRLNTSATAANNAIGATP
jgi:hypothetical protein